MLKNIRQLHLYLGTFFAPAIIFFAVSGAFQTFGLHEGRSRNAAVAGMAEVHIHQKILLPPEATAKVGGAKEAAEPGEERGREDKPPAGKPSRKSTASSHMLTKIFVLLMAIGLVVTTVLGVYMAFKYNRDKRVVWGLLILGTVLFIFSLSP